MLLYLGWVVAAFLIGFGLAWWLRRREKSLRRRVSQIPLFRGKTYAEILRELGGEPHSTIRQADDSALRTWRDKGGYSISLAFDARDLCMGVVEEKERKGRDEAH